MSRAIDVPTNDRYSTDNVLGVVRKRWWVIALCGILAAAAAGLITIRQPKQYAATSELLMRADTQPDQAVQNLLGIQPTGVAADPTQQAATDVALLSLQPIASMTASALGHGFTAAGITSAVAVTQVGQSNVVSVTATDSSPQTAARIANTYAAQVVTFRRRTDQSVINTTIANVQHQLKALPASQRTGATDRKLNTELNQLSLLSAAQTGDAEVVQRATVPTSASGPRTGLNTGVGLLLGLLLGFGIALVLDRFDKRVSSTDQLEDAFGLPVLGIVPKTKEIRLAVRDRGRHLHLVDGGHHNGDPGAVNGHLVLPPPTAEAFRNLRTRVKYLNRNRPIGSLLVTSASRGEGKSTVAWQLARVAAMSRKGRVLVVEADLRRPSLARAHDLRVSPGIGEILAGFVDMDDAIQHVDPLTEESTPDDRDFVAHDAFDEAFGDALAEAAGWFGSNNSVDSRSLDEEFGASARRGSELLARERSSLDVLVAGTTLESPADVLDSDEMRALLAAVQEHYDTVVIDAPPFPAVSDAMPLVTAVDGVIIVSSLRHASRDAAIRLREELEQLHAPVLGVVANNAKRSSGSYYYDYAERGATRSGAPAAPAVEAK